MKLPRSARLAIALGAFAGSALGLLAYGLAPNGPTAPPPIVADDGAARFAPGRTDAWSVQWATSAARAVPTTDRTLAARSRLDAEVHVTTLSERGGRFVSAARLAKVRHLGVVVDEQRLDLPLDDLQRVTARVEHDGRGEIRRIQFAADASDVAVNTLTGVLHGLFVEILGDGRRTTSYGVAKDRWWGARRTTTGYERVAGVPLEAAVQADGEAAVRRGTGGRVLSLRSTETIAATQGDSTLLTVADDWTVRYAGPGQTVRLPSAPVEASAVRVARSTQKVGDGTVERFRSVVHEIDDASPEDVQDLLWRGTSQIAADPELAAALALDVVAPGRTTAEREVTLDLLAQAGAPHAADALRRALSSDALREDPDYPYYLQRLSFVAQPGPADVAFLEEALNDPSADVRGAALASMGAMAARLRALGETTRATEVTDQLREKAADPDDRANALVGLGNAADPADVPLLTAAAKQGPASERVAALHALRSHDVPEVREVLRASLGDAHPAVQRAAWSRMGDRVLRDGDRKAMADVIHDGQLAGSNLQLAMAAMAYDSDEVEVRQALVELVEHPAGDPHSRARARALLTR